MTNSQPLIPLLFLLTASWWTASAFEPPKLRYRFEPGTTNVFKLELEMKTEDGAITQQGSLTVITSVADGRTATLGFTSRLLPQSMPMRPPSFGPGWNPFEFRGMNYGSQMPCQVELDDQGHVLRTMGELYLPPPFHELYHALFPVFPETPVNQWIRKSEQELPADAWSGGRRPPVYYSPMGPYGRAPARMTAIREERCQVVAVNDNLAQLQQELTYESMARIDNTPRWRITGTAKINFDMAAGQLQSLELPCTAIWTAETVIRRAPMVLRCQRVPPSELPALLATLAPKAPANLNEDELRKLLADMDSGEDEKRMKANNILNTANVSSVGPEMLARLEEQAKNSDMQYRMSIVRILAQHATTAQAPLLLSLLKSSDMSMRMEVIKALGRLKEKRAAEPLAEMVARGNGDYGASEALKQIGPPAEPAVLTLLQEKHQQTRSQACEILRQIGTIRSLEPLRAVLLSSDDMVCNAARQAIQEIQARVEMRDTSER